MLVTSIDYLIELLLAYVQLLSIFCQNRCNFIHCIQLIWSSQCTSNQIFNAFQLFWKFTCNKNHFNEQMCVFLFGQTEHSSSCGDCLTTQMVGILSAAACNMIRLRWNERNYVLYVGDPWCFFISFFIALTWIKRRVRHVQCLLCRHTHNSSLHTKFFLYLIFCCCCYVSVLCCYFGSLGRMLWTCWCTSHAHVFMSRRFYVWYSNFCFIIFSLPNKSVSFFNLTSFVPFCSVWWLFRLILIHVPYHFRISLTYIFH